MAPADPSVWMQLYERAPERIATVHITLCNTIGLAFENRDPYYRSFASFEEMIPVVKKLASYHRTIKLITNDLLDERQFMLTESYHPIHVRVVLTDAPDPNHLITFLGNIHKYAVNQLTLPASVFPTLVTEPCYSQIAATCNQLTKLTLTYNHDASHLDVIRNQTHLFVRDILPKLFRLEILECGNLEYEDYSVVYRVLPQCQRLVAVTSLAQNILLLPDAFDAVDHMKRVRMLVTLLIRCYYPGEEGPYMTPDHVRVVYEMIL